jgi:hypothetical protein
MGFPKYLAIRVSPFLALHKNSRIKANNDLISASLSGIQASHTTQKKSSLPALFFMAVIPDGR